MFDQIINPIPTLLITAGLLISTLVNLTTHGLQDEGSGGQLAHLSHFQVESHATLFGRESATIDAEVRVREQYSNERGRARLEFQFQEYATNGRARNGDHDGHSPPSHVNYIFSAKSNKLLRVVKVPAAARPKCELSNRTALAGDLFGLEGERSWLKMAQVSDLRAPELAHWERLLSGLAMPGHVIGFARLLLFVELNRQDFRRVERSQGSYLRNAQVEQFKLTFKVPEWGGAGGDDDAQWTAPITAKEATMIMYLSSGSGAGPHSGLPIRVWLQLPSGAELIVDFSSVGPASFQVGASGDLVSAFNFPLGRGCSQQLSEVRSAGGADATASGHKSALPHPPSKRKSNQAVFSFEARLSELWFLERPAQLGHLFVAYDAHAKALRVNSYVDLDETTTTTTIHDFALGRKFHLSATSGVESEDPDSGPVWWSVESAQNGGRKCLVTRISAREQADMQAIEEPILPWCSLVEMGSALVRGIETQVFEMVSERLPRFLFQQVAYLDLAGDERLAFNLKRKVSAG